MAQGDGASTGTVLVVDDSPTMRDWLESALSPICKVSLAATHDAALDALRSRAFDALIADFELGDGTGLALINEVDRVRPGTARILLTAHKDYSEVREAQRLGKVLVIFKPVEVKVLLGWVANAITMARLNQATKLLDSRRIPRQKADLPPGGGAATSG